MSKMQEGVKNLQKMPFLGLKMKEKNKKIQKSEKNIQKGIDKFVLL